MFRSPVNILLYVLCPILISAILISAFSSLMESYEAPGEFEVGYTVEEDSPYAGIVSALAPVGKENGIIFNRYDGGTPEELLQSRELGGFITFTKEGYTIYESKNRQVEGAKLEYMISAVYNSMISGNVSDIRIPTESPEVAPAISSTDYYGMPDLFRKSDPHRNRGSHRHRTCLGDIGGGPGSALGKYPHFGNAANSFHHSRHCL